MTEWVILQIFGGNSFSSLCYGARAENVASPMDLFCTAPKDRIGKLGFDKKGEVDRLIWAVYSPDQVNRMKKANRCVFVPLFAKKPVRK